MNSTISTMRKDQTIQIRVSTSLKNKLQALADEHNTTINKVIMISLSKQYPELLDDILKD